MIARCAMAGIQSAEAAASKVFSGDQECALEYKRWKTWVSNKLLTLDSKVPTTARGAYVYTLLAGKALDCIEHLEPGDYQKEGGEKVIFDLLDRRFPQKDTSDEMSEVLTSVFNLRAQEGETLKVWISRSGELFDRCQRKCKVNFPDEARGWLTLNRSGLNEEQKAVILARSGGDLRKDEIGRAMRSCYPDYVVPKRKSFGAGLVEASDETAAQEEDDADSVFQEVEALIADHGERAEEPDEVYDESEVAEALAVSWKDKRRELGRMQRSRKFGAASDLRKSYRVEIEELKRKTRCHKCNQVGHWSRECKAGAKGKSKGSQQGQSGSKSSESGAAMVETFTEHFVAAVGSMQDPENFSALTWLRQKRASTVVECNKVTTPPAEVLLVSSPGYGVIDSGCGRTIIGRETLNDFQQLWRAHGIPVPSEFAETNHFKFGNGQRETSEVSVKLPVVIAGRSGSIKAAIVLGAAPLLISRSALQALHAVIDFGTNQLSLFTDGIKVPLTTNAAGQYTIKVIDQVSSEKPPFQEVMLTQDTKVILNSGDSDASLTAEPVVQPPVDQARDETSETCQDSSKTCSGAVADLQVWCRDDSFLHNAVTSGKQGPSWQQVRRRRIINSDTNEVLFDEWISPHRKKSQYHQTIPKEVLHTRTEFHFVPQEKSSTFECLPVHFMRQLHAQVSQSVTEAKSLIDGKPFLVAEVFCPPRCAPLVEGVGGVCKSFDLSTGFDFTKPEVRDQVAQELKDRPPDLLLLSPPCTHEGGWFNLNACTMDPKEYLQKVRQSRMFIRFCCKLYEQQVQLGGRALMEHPKGSRIWSYPEVQALRQQGHLLTCHMCRFGLRIPNSTQLIRKATHLLASHEDMNSLARECPGPEHPRHQCHQTIAGSCPEVGSISKFAGKYTPQFVEAIMDTVPRFNQLKQDCLVVCPEWSTVQCDEVLAAKPELSSDKSDEELLKVIDRVHRNLGHPPAQDLIRIFKHAQASDRAIQLVHKHKCSFCQSQIKPHVPLPAKSSRPREFNQTLGIDVKNLNGWRPNQKVKALNMVDQASCYQLMVPFHERETSEVIRKIVAEHWVRVFGPPKEVILDQAQTNLGEGLQGYLDSLGSHVHQIAGEAHWQLGRTESHGGWFSRVLDRTIAEHVPGSREDWDLCVTHAHVKNTMIQSYGHTPHQYVFGRNPDVPTDLMSEPLHVVPATLGLTNEAIAKSQAIRSAARKAVIETQDDLALRRAFSARPRLQQQFHPGDLVAYWRVQKVQEGKVVLGGRWYGTAVVIGSIGKNYVVAHRRQIFRVAPEQLRPATTEERALVTTPQAELLGIKDLLEGGTFKSHQYVDLVPAHYPPMAPGPDDQSHPQDPAVSEPVDKGPMPSVATDQPMETEARETSSQAETNVSSSPDISDNAVPGESSSASGSRAMPESLPDESNSQYGPMRRIHGKNGPVALYRPPAMREHDFTEMMREIVPRLVEHAMNPADAPAESHKRSLETSDSTAEPPGTRLKTGEQEVLSVEDITELVEQWHDPETPIEVMVANYMQKKTGKEIPPSNNPHALQSLVDDSKRTEWQTILEKNAVKVHYGKRAAQILENHPDRFIGSRFVIIKKPVEENQQINDDDPLTYRVKSRWCLQGHLDPDLSAKVHDGLLQSPTLSQMGRMLIMQLIASHGWDLQLGDIKGAFLEAGPLPSKFRPLFAKQPIGGIPGVPKDAVLEVTGNVYGQNDAPLAWHRTFDDAAQEIGWQRSKLDSCLYFLRDDSGRLCGVMGVHVDDTALGGAGDKFQQAVTKLRARFPYRKWRVGTGEFCGAFYSQDKTTKVIKMSQRLFAEKIRPASISKSAAPDDVLSDSQIKVLRAINGSLNWLSSQSRPDLAVQTSMSQQAFPHPTVRHLRDANNAVRRAKMHKDLEVTFQPILPQNLCICCHSDAAFANVGSHTQAGFIVAFVEQSMHSGEVSHWTPAVWKSYKLPRAVSSTLGGESQAMATATGTVEWLNLLLTEAIDGSFEPRDCRQLLSKRPAILATDCKSLYDHLISPSSPTSVEDRRTSIDIVIIRESIKLLGAQIRWLPTNRMIADGLTKDKVDPVDLLRSCVRAASYQISPEDHVLAQQAAERARRAQIREQNLKSSETSGGNRLLNGKAADV